MPETVCIVPIVEGRGEVAATPILIRRIAEAVAPSVTVMVRPPIRVPRDRFLRKDGELERYLDMAVVHGGGEAGILILLDADSDCPGALGPEVLERASTARPDKNIAVVFAKCEYETWFLAALESLTPGSAQPPDDVEAIRGAKERLRRLMQSQYSPTADQARLTARFDMSVARSRSRSFDKLWRAVEQLMAVSSA